MSMPDETLPPTETHTVLSQLFTTVFWEEHPFQIMEQEQVMLKIIEVLSKEQSAAERYNIEQTLPSLEAALEKYSCELFPVQWAMTQVNLGAVYMMRKDGKKAGNLQMSIVYGQSALNFLTRTTYPFEWAGVHTYLGEAYRQATLYADLQELYSGCPIMQEVALRHLEAALQVYTKHSYPMEWVWVQQCLGYVYLDRVQDRQYKNLARARDCFKAVLEVWGH